MLQLKESRHAKWIYHAANIICKILQIPCNMKGSIFHMANTHTNSVVCFFCLFGVWLYSSPIFILLGFAKLYGRASWLHQQQPQQQQ